MFNIGALMDADGMFSEISDLLSKGLADQAVAKVRLLSENDSDPFVLIKCLSLLKVISDDTLSRTILAKLLNNLPENEQVLVQIAGSLRGLDYPTSAYGILHGMKQDDTVLRLECMCLKDTDEYELALEAVKSIQAPEVYDTIMLTEVLSALGEHVSAVSEAEKLLIELPDDFDVRRTYASALLLAGKNKEATKFVRGILKEKSSDANALAAYVMLVTGNIKAAAGYASRAIKLDSKNISAMETFGICLAQKKEYDKARIVAGAINEISPGSRSAINILKYCEGHRRTRLSSLLNLLTRLFILSSFQNPGVRRITAVRISRRPIHISSITVSLTQLLRAL